MMQEHTCSFLYLFCESTFICNGHCFILSLRTVYGLKGVGEVGQPPQYCVLRNVVRITVVMILDV